MQGWESRMMAKALFSSQGWSSLIFSVKGSETKWHGWILHIWELWWRQEAACRWKVIFSEDRWPFFNPKCNLRRYELFCLHCGITFAGSDGRASWKVSLRARCSRGKGCPFDTLPHAILLNNPCWLTFSFTPHLFLSSPLVIIFLPYASNLLVANRTESATDPWVTCFMDYFRSNPIKVNVSTVGKSLWITK